MHYLPDLEQITHWSRDLWLYQRNLCFPLVATYQQPQVCHSSQLCCSCNNCSRHFYKCRCATFSMFYDGTEIKICIEKNSTNTRVVLAEASLAALMPNLREASGHVRMTPEANQNNQSFVIQLNKICHQFLFLTSPSFLQACRRYYTQKHLCPAMHRWDISVPCSWVLSLGWKTSGCAPIRCFGGTALAGQLIWSASVRFGRKLYKTAHKF